MEVWRENEEERPVDARSLTNLEEREGGRSEGGCEGVSRAFCCSVRCAPQPCRYFARPSPGMSQRRSWMLLWVRRKSPMLCYGPNLSVDPRISIWMGKRGQPRRHGSRERRYARKCWVAYLCKPLPARLTPNSDQAPACSVSACCGRADCASKLRALPLLVRVTELTTRPPKGSVELMKRENVPRKKWSSVFVGCLERASQPPRFWLFQSRPQAATGKQRGQAGGGEGGRRGRLVIRLMKH